MISLLEKVRVCEGAMGTMLFALGAKFGDDLTGFNVERPDMVRRVHELYHEAGATVAISNTFTPCTSDDPAEIERAARCNEAAVRLAREAGAEFVLGDASPCSYVLEPLGPSEFDRNFEVYRRHLASLADAGADALLLETFIDIADLRCAILAAREAAPGVPVIASCTFNEDLAMALSSTTPEAAAIICESLGADAVGVNCGFGPDRMIEVAERMSAVTSLPLIVQPNAGLPEYLDDGTTRYPGTPEELALYAGRFIECGAAIIGSCCGSTPEFTAALAEAVEREGAKPHASREPVVGTWIASMSEAMPLDDAIAGIDAALEFDCATEDFDRWDVLENVTACPFLIVSSAADGFDSCLGTLGHALRLYPGRATVRIDGGDAGKAEALAREYGAVVI